MQGVVFNGHYLTYFDIGITEYLRALHQGDATTMTEVFHHMYARKATVEYHAPARFDDEVKVAARTHRMGKSSMGVTFALFRDGQLLASGESVYVYAHDGKSMPIPEALRARIRGFERVAPLEA